MKKKTAPVVEKAPESPVYVVVASGPSLDDADLYALEAAQDQWPGRHVVIAVGDAFRRVKKFDMLYACDYLWWQNNIEEVRSSVHASVRLATIDPEAAKKYTLELIPCLDLHVPRVDLGFSGVPGVITSGCSSGYQALHIAANEGGKRILLLGYDYGATGQIRGDGTPSLSNFPLMLQALEALAVGLGRNGVEVINCSTHTAVACFLRSELADAL